jgi:hypothetical protein
MLRSVRNMCHLVASCHAAFYPLKKISCGFFSILIASAPDKMRRSLHCDHPEQGKSVNVHTRLKYYRWFSDGIRSQAINLLPLHLFLLTYICSHMNTLQKKQAAPRFSIIMSLTKSSVKLRGFPPACSICLFPGT